MVLFTQDAPHPAVHGGWGADEVVGIEGDLVEEDIAGVVSEWGRDGAPWAILAPSTAWGREVAGRVAVRLGAGLTGDAIDLEARDGRLCAWKPAFGGQLVVAIHTSSPCQMATVRAGVLPALTPRTSTADVRTLTVASRGRVHVASRTRDDDLDVLAEAQVVVGVGQAVAPEEYPSIQPLLDVLDGQLAATRKVTDKGWLPRARQLGITGRTITPRLYIALGIGGKFAHMVGARSSGTILAVNANSDARVFASADVGIVADWHDVIEPLVSAIERAREARKQPGT